MGEILTKPRQGALRADMKEIIIRNKSGGIELRFMIVNAQLEIAKKLGIDEMTYIKKYTELMLKHHREQKNETKNLRSRGRRSGKTDKSIQPQTSDSARIVNTDDNQGGDTGRSH
jgi:predicted metal-dependent hydrolase